MWFHWVLFANKLIPDDVVRLDELGEDLDMLAENIEEWKKQWQQGWKEGWHQGIIEGQSNLLQQLLIEKFGSLSNGTVNRLQNANESQLQFWAKHLLTATTLNEIFDA